MDYSAYKDLQIRQLESGILEIVMGEEGKLAVATWPGVSSTYFGQECS